MTNDGIRAIGLFSLLKPKYEPCNKRYLTLWISLSESNLVHLTNKSILETFKKVKKDKSPFSNRKITLSVYKEFLKKNKIWYLFTNIT